MLIFWPFAAIRSLFHWSAVKSDTIETINKIQNCDQKWTIHQVTKINISNSPAKEFECFLYAQMVNRIFRKHSIDSELRPQVHHSIFTAEPGHRIFGSKDIPGTQKYMCL